MSPVDTYSPDTIKRTIMERLRRNRKLGGAEISVELHGDKAVLSGTVATPLSAQAAETEALTTPGVDFVDNRLKTEQSLVTDVPLDDETRENVEKILKYNENLCVEDIQVSVFQGVVTLAGTVDSYWKKLRAEEMVSAVIGVISVLNELAVVPKQDVEDERIAKELLDILERVYTMDITAISVQVKDGTVTLAGTVPNRDSFRLAENEATYMRGVKNVVNNLMVDILTPNLGLRY